MTKLLKALLIEDSEDDAELVLAHLRRAGYQVDSRRVENRAGLSAALANGGWDVVIADFSLPHFSAPEALQLLKDSGRDLPFIIVSGTITEESAVSALRAGADDFITKGRLARLAPAIERSIREARVRAERQHEQALRLEQQSIFNQLAENIRQVLWMFEAPGPKTLFVSRAYQEIWGRSLQSLYDDALSYIEVVHPDDQAAVRAAMASKAQGQACEIEYRIVRPDGALRWIRDRGFPIHDEHGRVVRAAGIAEDITDRREAQAALADSERRFRALIEHNNDAILLLDGTGTISYLSPAGLNMMGLALEEVPGRNAFELLHPDDVAPSQEVLAQLMATPSAIAHHSFRLRHMDGGWRWMDAVASNLLDDDGISAIVVNFRDVTERRQAQEQIERQLQRLATLRTIDMAIASSFDLKLILRVLLDQICSQLQVDAADVLLFNPGSLALEFAAGHGFRSGARAQSSQRLGEGHAGQAALQRRIVREDDLRRAGSQFNHAQVPVGEDFVSYYGVPLITKGEVKGVLEIFHRAPMEPDAEWLTFLDALAGQSAIAIDNASLYNSLQRSNLDLTLAYDVTIEGWARALDLRDKETEGHSRRVTEMTLRLASAMGLPEEQMVHIRRGALLHDIGKMGVPDRVLLKTGPLTSEEWIMMRLHTSHAFQLLAPVEYLRPALSIPQYHHEKWDGSGYPNGLRGEQIPLEARIFAVADVWDALRSDRPYRKAWNVDQARQYIEEQSGMHFDPAAVAAFMALIEEMSVV